MQQLGYSYYNSASGWFDPETLKIFVSFDAASFDAKLTPSQKQVLNHELMHYIHFTSSTLGIRFFTTHFKELNQIATWKLVHNPSGNLEGINDVYREVIKCNRYKSKMLVPSYYYEEGPQIDAIEPPQNWGVNTSLATFLNSEGRTSNENLFLYRFLVNSKGKNFHLFNDCVIRTSIGTRVLYEHVIRFLDIITDYARIGEQAFEDNLYMSYEGRLLEYSAMALICARNGIIGFGAFVLSAIVSHIALMIPMEWPQNLSKMRNYVETKVRAWDSRPEVRNYSFNISHPSVVTYALLSKAVDFGGKQYAFDKMFLNAIQKDDYSEINDLIDLLLIEFDITQDDLFDYTTSNITAFKEVVVHDQLKNIQTKLAQEMEKNLAMKKVNLGRHIMKPDIPTLRPYINIGDRHEIDSGLLTEDERGFLDRLIKWRDEVLKFPYERNIVD